MSRNEWVPRGGKKFKDVKVKKEIHTQSRYGPIHPIRAKVIKDILVLEIGEVPFFAGYLDFPVLQKHFPMIESSTGKVSCLLDLYTLPF